MKKIIKYSFIGIIFLTCFIFKDYIYRLIGAFNYASENEVIKTNNQILQSENNSLKEELDRLKESKGLEVDNNYEYIVSKVLLRNPYTFFDSMVISKGSKDGIKKDMAVIGENGLIGTISEVNKNSSKVNLLTNPQNEISVIIHGSYGILSGYSKENDSLIIKHMNNYNNIEVGDLVYTSGLGKLPQGILIGRVEKIIYDKYQIEQYIYVKSKNNLNEIFYTGIILDIQEES